TCPLWRPSVPARTVSTTCGRSPASGKRSRSPAACRTSGGGTPSGHTRRGLGIISACAPAPGSGFASVERRWAVSEEKVLFTDACCTDYVKDDAERKNSRSAKLERELNRKNCCRPDHGAW